MDDMSNLIQQLVELVKQTAPELWRIANLQVEANIIGTRAWAISVSVIAGVLFLIALFAVIHEIKEYGDLDTFGGWLSFVCSLMFGAVVVGLFVSITKMQINTEYYAIQVLMQLVK